MVIKRDFRTLAPATQAELRRVAVAMVRAGKTRIEAAETVGVNRRFVGQWVKVAAQGGEAVLAGRRRGRRPGEQKALSAVQEDRLRVLIARGCPDQFGLSFALWTRQAVRALIARETGVWLTLSVVGRYLRAWGFTAQRPARRATERRDEAVRAWLESTYPAIARKAQAQGCDIQWADETGLSNQANYGRSFSPRGQTPVIRRPGKRFSQSMISSLTNRGKLRFMIYEGAPCCMDRGCGRTEPELCSGSCDADILWASEVQHTVQHVGGDRHLGRLTPVRLEAQSVTDDALPSRDVSLHQSAPVVP